MIGIITIFATFIARNESSLSLRRAEVQDIEMQALSQSNNKHEITLRAMEKVLRLFRTET